MLKERALGSRKNMYLSVFFILLMMALIHRLWAYFAYGETDVESWGMSEWLLNYQGGFVRRGLAGEIIYQARVLLGIDPRALAVGVSLVSFILLASFFCIQFIKKGYPIFILPFTLFLGNPIVNGHWLRKDSFLLLLLIGVIYAFVNIKSKWYKYILINLLLIVGALMHEISIIITCPILVFLMIRELGSNGLRNTMVSLVRSFFLLSPAFVAVVFALCFKGDGVVAKAIWDSWYELGVFSSPIIEYKTAIAGMSWDADFAMTYPTRVMLTFIEGVRVYPLFTYSIVFLGIYYVLSNLNKINISILGFAPRVQNTLTISSVLIFQFLFTLIPLLILGCDSARWIYIWVSSAFIITFLIPEKRIEQVLPLWLSGATTKFNKLIVSIVGNSTGTVVLVAICLGFPFILGVEAFFSTCFDTSPLNLVLEFVSKFLKRIV